MQIHPAAALFPLLPQDELQALADDILAHGQLYPIMLLDSAVLDVLDGRNQLAACELVNVEPWFADYDGDSPTDYVVSANLKRRNLTTLQAAAVGLDLIPLFEEEAKARQVANLKRGDVAPVVSELTQREEPGRVRTQAAKAVGISDGSLGEAAVLRKASPEIFKAIVESGDKKATLGRVRHAITTMANAALPPVVPPTGEYSVVVIDPPWPMEKIERDVRPNQVAMDYPTMTEEELAAFHIPAADSASVCFAANLSAMGPLAVERQLAALAALVGLPAPAEETSP